MLFLLRNNLALYIKAVVYYSLLRLSPLYHVSEFVITVCYMATKRKREDNSEVNFPDGLRNFLSSAITSDAYAKVALLHIMKEYNLRRSLLQHMLTRPFILFELSEAI